MFYRRKLPHWHPDKDEASFLFVTWRLSGSIPQVRLPQRLAGESACPTSSCRTCLSRLRPRSRQSCFRTGLAEGSAYSKCGGPCPAAWRERKTLLPASSLGDHAEPRACGTAGRDPPAGNYTLVERLHSTTSQPDPGPNGKGFLAR